MAKYLAVIIDIQGYGNFLPKELAIAQVTIDKKERSCLEQNMVHFVFKPPFPLNSYSRSMRKQVNWLERKHHCLKWNTGFTNLSELPQILRYFTSFADKIYVKGNQKKSFLESYIDAPIYDLQDTTCPKLKPQAPECGYHSSSNCICALSNVFELLPFCIETFCE